MTILFVCTGNTCRSAMAEGMMKDIISKDQKLKEVEVISAGTRVCFEGPASYGAKSALEVMNINIEGHKSKPLTLDMINKADLILAMTISHKLRVIDMNLEAKGKSFTLKEFAGQIDIDIQDPFGLSMDGYEKCALEIYNALVKVKEKIKVMKK